LRLKLEEEGLKLLKNKIRMKASERREEEAERK
jgi:hypothetical protein